MAILALLGASLTAATVPVAKISTMPPVLGCTAGNVGLAAGVSQVTREVVKTPAYQSYVDPRLRKTTPDTSS